MGEEQNIPENKGRIISTVNNENNSPGENVFIPNRYQDVSISKLLRAV
jgi:hypothetical protein